MIRQYVSILLGDPRKLSLLVIVALLAVLSLDAGPGCRQTLSAFLAALCIVVLLRDPGSPALLMAETRSAPMLLFSLAALLLFSGVSIAYSYDPAYSARIFLLDFCLYIVLFIFLSVFVSIYLNTSSILDHLKKANILFLGAYYLFIIQWILFPSYPFYGKTGILNGMSALDIFFLFPYTNDCFSGILHISIFVLFFICISFVSITYNNFNKSDVAILVLNMLVLILTTKRAGIIAVLSGVMCAPFLIKGAYKYSVALCLGMCVAFGFILISNTGSHFIRENWDLILEGKVKEAKEAGGSMPLRVFTYKAFGAQVLEHPFKGVGFGRRNIKHSLSEIGEKAGLGHGHNALLNFALQTGVQGALALLGCIVAQTSLWWSALKKAGPDVGDRIFLSASLLFMLMFWISNTFEDAFRHQSVCYYWLIAALATGISFRVLREARNSRSGRATNEALATSQ